MKAARYPCNGGEVTVREVAQNFGISPETVRIRLNKCGGNMQKVWDHYAAEPAKPGLSAEEQAAAEILGVLMPDEDEAEEASEEASGAGEIGPAQAEGPQAALERLNRAIDALSGVYETDVGSLANDLRRFIGELRAFRARKYERYVDWAAVAENVGK